MESKFCFLVGAAKSGTTSLYHYLSNHPDINTPIIKEPNYFSHINKDERNVKITGKGRGDKGTVWINSKKEYLNLFSKNNKKWSLDASVSYLYSNTAAKEIYSFQEDSKIIMVLRNPIERAWSHYSHLYRDAREQKTFNEAFKIEEKRIKQGYEFSWHYKNMGLYFNQVKRYLDTFGEDNVLIFLHEDLKYNFNEVIDNVINFLEIEKNEVKIPIKKSNLSGISKSKKIAYFLAYIGKYKKDINRIISPKITHKLLNIIRNLNLKKDKVIINEKDRLDLISFYREDIIKTQELIKRDLSNWLI